jgi:hypothetical protein
VEGLAHAQTGSLDLALNKMHRDLSPGAMNDALSINSSRRGD